MRKQLFFMAAILLAVFANGQTLNVNGNVTIPAGTYTYSQLQINNNATLTLSTGTTLNVLGNTKIYGALQGSGTLDQKGGHIYYYGNTGNVNVGTLKMSASYPQYIYDYSTSKDLVMDHLYINNTSTVIATGSSIHDLEVHESASIEGNLVFSGSTSYLRMYNAVFYVLKGSITRMEWTWNFKDHSDGITQTIAGTSLSNWSHISIPLDEVHNADFEWYSYGAGNGSSIYEWDEVSTGQTKPDFVDNHGGAVERGKGYLTYTYKPSSTSPAAPVTTTEWNLNNDPVVVCSGTLPSANEYLYTWNMTNSGRTHSDNSWNNLGNPYPATIDLNKISSSPSAALTSYALWDQEAGVYRYGNPLINTWFNWDGNGEVHAGSSFWVKASSATNTTWNIDANAIVDAPATNSFKMANGGGSGVNSHDMIMVTKGDVEMGVVNYASASDGIDPYDAVANEWALDNLYLETASKEFAIATFDFCEGGIQVNPTPETTEVWHFVDVYSLGTEPVYISNQLDINAVNDIYFIDQFGVTYYIDEGAGHYPDLSGLDAEAVNFIGRIKIVCPDFERGGGRKSSQKTIGLDESVITHKSVKVFPNPANSIINFDTEEGSKITLLDLTGKVVKETSEKSLNIEDLSNGVYLWRVELPSGKIENGKVIVE